MKIKIFLNKTISGNAEYYFNKAKKAKKKLEGARKALKELKERLEKLKKEKAKEIEKKKIIERKKAKAREWFEKFRWFISSEGFLCIGGRDATTNEILIKKYTSKEDIVFHAEFAGSPFFVVKTEGKKPGKETLQEVADATVSFSKAWKQGLHILEVFYVNPDQITKKTKAGEYLKKGSFMIYGKKNRLNGKLNLAIGIYKGKVMIGPLEAIKKNCKNYVKLIRNGKKTLELAKKICKMLDYDDVDEVLRALPINSDIEEK